jgi:PAS domain S-box-containing protein
MKDKPKTNEQLLNELTKLRKRVAELEKSQSELKHIEEKYRNIFENSTEGMYRVTPEGRFISTNPAAARLLGYESPEELINSVTDIFSQVCVHPGDGDTAVGLLRTHGVLENFQMKCRRKDGNTAWGLFNARLVLDDHGNVLYIEGTGQDITELKQKEEIIRKGEERFRSIADYAYDWENWVGPDGKFIWINPGVSRLTGYSAEECMVMDNFPMSIIYQSDTERVERLYNEAVQGSIGNDIEFRICRKDGDVRWAAVSWQPIYDGNGAWLGHRSSIRDITERKLMEEALRQSEQSFRNLSEASLEAIVFIEDGLIIDANEALNRLFGYEGEDLRGRLATDFIVPEKRPFTDERMRTRTVGAYETLGLRKDGSTFPIEVNPREFDNDGKRIRISAVRDMTVWKKAEQQVKEYQNHLEQLVEERTKELRMKSINLEEINIALKVLLEQREKDKTELENKILFNVKKLVLPYLDFLKRKKLDDEQKIYLDVLEANLKNIISPFAKKLISIHATFTPQEIKIADLIREGKTVKEIALALGVSENTTNSHRQHIRGKLGLNNQRINLRTYLLSLAD